MKTNIIKSKWFGNLLFLLIFVAMFFYYGLHESMFYPPQSVHVWRQTNCLSLTQNYYQHDLPFLQPEMHNQFGNGGTSGKAVGEFPIIYYLVAQLWDFFGKHEWIFKLVQILIFFTGTLALFSTLKYLFKNYFWAAFVSLLVFTSPMIVFYGPNFLPDVPALALVFIAWYFVIRFTRNRRQHNLWWSALFFCLAMLLKVTSAISFIALGGWVVFELIFQQNQQRIFNFKIKHFLPFVLSLLPVIAWYFYADYYNSVNQGHFSVHGIWPIWNITEENFLRVIDVQRKIYFKQLFWPVAQYLTVAIWLFLLITIKRMKPVFRYFVLVLPAGFIMQVLFWFQILDYHDYYMINLVVVLVAVWTIFVIQFRALNLSRYLKYAVYGFFTLFFVWNVVTCREHLQIRYRGWMNAPFTKFHQALLEIEPLFKRLGISKDDKVISLPDTSINSTLYYMNRKGYTTFGSDFSKKETFYRRIEQGAKYLIVNDSTILSSEVLQPFVKNKIGKFENVSVYDIRNIKPENQQPN